MANAPRFLLWCVRPDSAQACYLLANTYTAEHKPIHAPMSPDQPTGLGPAKPGDSLKPRTGLVTLLFTDMVGSTALKQQLGDQSGAALFGKHHQCVRELLRCFPTGQE